MRSKGSTYAHFRTALLNPCYYGTDIDTKENLIACHYPVEEIAKQIGVDSLSYLPVGDLKT